MNDDCGNIRSLGTSFLLASGHINVSQEQLQNTPLKSRRGEGLASTCQVSSVPGSLNEAISYVLPTRIKVKVKGTSVRIILSCKLDHRTRQFNFLCAGYASMHGYASKLRLRVLVFELFCGVGWIMKRGNFSCAGYASTLGYVSKLKLRVPVFVVFCVGGGSLKEAICYVLAMRQT